MDAEKNEQQNETNKKEKKSKKKIIIISVVIILILLIAGVCGGTYYFLKTEENKVAEVTKQQEEAFLEFSEEIKYGTEITYEDLLAKLIDVSKLQENTKITVEINENELKEREKFTFNALGIYKIKAKLEYVYVYPIVESISKQVENEKTVEINIMDTEKPVITGVANKEITEGDTINLADGITATDDVDGQLEVQIEGTVDNTKAGEYSIKVKATDKSGNTEEATFTVTVKAKPVVKPKTNTNSNKNTNTSTNTNKNSNTSTNNNTTTEKRTFTTEELKAEATKAKSTYRSQINAVLNCTNKYRQEAGQGLSNLVLDETLTTAACMRAIEMAYSGVLAHERPDGRDCFTVFDEVNVYPMTCGENIAWGQTTPEKAAEWWRNSPGHYMNMVMPLFGKIGIGAFKLNGRFYWVQLFTD